MCVFLETPSTEFPAAFWNLVVNDQDVLPMMVRKLQPLTFRCRSPSTAGSFPQANHAMATKLVWEFKFKPALLSGQSYLGAGWGLLLSFPVTRVTLPMSVFCKFIDRKCQVILFA